MRPRIHKPADFSEDKRSGRSWTEDGDELAPSNKSASKPLVFAAAPAAAWLPAPRSKSPSTSDGAFVVSGASSARLRSTYDKDTSMIKENDKIAGHCITQ